MIKNYYKRIKKIIKFSLENFKITRLLIIYNLPKYRKLKVFDKLINLIDSRISSDELSAITFLPLLVLFISLFFTFNMTTLKTVWIGSTIVSSILIGILVFIGSALAYGGGAVR
jgi:hypothetical protein